MRTLRPSVVALLAVLGVPAIAWSQSAATLAEPRGAPGVPEAWSRWGDFEHRPAFEVNVLFPFLGLEDLRLMVPVLRAGRRDWRGELVFGVSTDYAFGPLSRPVEDYGKVFVLTGRVGYRQFLWNGFHVEVALNLGWRHEAYNLHDGAPTLDGGYGRAWFFAGYQLDLTSNVYVNLRGDAGLLLFRTDRFAAFEKKVIPAGEINIGVRL
jgi:hypothetical protein